MKNKKLLLKDLNSVTSGILSTVSGMKKEIENLIQLKVDKYMNSRGYVTREDFHALEDRFNKLEAEIIVKKKVKKNKKNNLL